MPKIVRFGGLSLSDDVVRIRDIAPSPGQKKKASPLPKAAPDDEAFEAVDFGVDEAGPGAEVIAFDGDDEAEDTGFEAADLDAPSMAAPRHQSRDTNAVREEVIGAAMAEATRIIEEAVQQAQQEKEAALATVAAEAEQLRRQAEEEGRAAGMAGATETVQATATALENAVATFEGERAGFEAEYEEQLRWLAIEIASKVLAKKVADDDAEMTEMVKKAVASVRSEPWVRIEVAQEMTGLIDALNAEYGGQQGVEVSGIPAAPGTVHIETPSGVVDASLKTQLANLRDYFVQNGSQ